MSSTTMSTKAVPTRKPLWRWIKRITSNYVVRMISRAIFTIWFVTSLIFFLVRLMLSDLIIVGIVLLVYLGVYWNLVPIHKMSGARLPIPLWERYGNNPAMDGLHTCGWLPDDNPIYKNSPYADSFTVLMILDGTLYPCNQ